MQRAYGAASFLIVIGLGYWVWRMLAPQPAYEHEATSSSSSVASVLQTLSGDPPLRVLFVGNSHTYMNDLPKMVAELADAAGQRPLAYETIAMGGARIKDHVERGEALSKLQTGGFDVLVMQEQQQWPTFSDEQREQDMDGPARTLAVSAQAVGTKPVLTMVWARRDGDPHNVPNDTFEGMHARTVRGHTECARNIGATLAPVAVAWKLAMEQRPSLALWQHDGSHPSEAGSYLAAYILYRVLYTSSPAGNPYTATLPTPDATFLQSLASTVSL